MNHDKMLRRAAKRVRDRTPVRDKIEPEPLSIEALLQWAFGVERARVEFDDHLPGALPGRSAEWLVMRQGAMLGRDGRPVQIDGGGYTPPPDDAQMVAGLVSALPEARGGRAMAALIVDCAVARRRPDALVGVVPRVEPKTMRRTSKGLRAGQEQIGWAQGRDRFERLRPVPVMWCPVVYSPPPAKIASMRRGYLQWWGALLHLRVQIGAVGLRRWVVTDEMPDQTPWKNER